MIARSASRGHALGVAGEARLLGQLGPLQHLVAEVEPLALVLQAEHHAAAVGAGGERAVGVDRGVRGAGARRRRRAVEGVVQRVAGPLGQRLEHRDVQMPASPGARAFEQRRQDAGVGVHAGRDVGDRRAGLARLAGRAGDRDEAGLALDQQVVGLLVAVRAVCPVAGDVADDQRRFLRRQRLVAQAQARGGARCQVLHDDVGLVQHQALQHFGRLGADVGRPGSPCCSWSRRSARPGRARAGRSRARSRRRGALDLMNAGAEVGNWRVANGAAIACSSVTTVRPFSGCMLDAPSAQRGGGVIVSQPSWSCAQGAPLPSALSPPGRPKSDRAPLGEPAPQALGAVHD